MNNRDWLNERQKKKKCGVLQMFSFHKQKTVVNPHLTHSCHVWSDVIQLLNFDTGHYKPQRSKVTDTESMTPPVFTHWESANKSRALRWTLCFFSWSSGVSAAGRCTPKEARGKTPPRFIFLFGAELNIQFVCLWLIWILEKQFILK